MALDNQQLIDAAVKRDIIDKRILENLRADARRSRLDLLDLLMVNYRLPKNAFYRAAAEQRGIPYIEYTHMQADLELLKKIPSALVNRKNYLPILQADDSVLLGTSDPDDRSSIETIRRLFKKPIKVGLSEPELLKVAIKQAYIKMDQALPSSLTAAATDVDIVKLLDAVFKEAYLRRSSDIHILIDEFGLRIRLRVDGKLQEYIPETESTGAVANSLISRIKVLADLDIAEQREPQDGGMSYYLPPPVDLEFNVRVATAPTRLGERLTMRILGQDAKDLTLAKIGMSKSDLARFGKSIRQPFGMILLTGPTGSGKSTTLFAALKEISAPDINIMTVENPIEYVIDGVSQIQTGAKVSFAGALRSFLRHDPDVLMVGEIRDEETADTALKAAMTGHLVFSTLHTNTAAGCISRLVDIGCEPFLIGSTMNAVIAQRLVRRLCEHCKKSADATNEEKALLGITPDDNMQIYHAVGCANCQGTGYRGRIGLFETLWFDDALRQFVSKGCTEEMLVLEAGDRLKHMWHDGIEKVKQGVTTLEEVQKVTVQRA
jgi:type II secretory ATPase GspE/PulE/Tfp pilus assembly ATPase PilB-like protein